MLLHALGGHGPPGLQRGGAPLRIGDVVDPAVASQRRHHALREFVAPLGGQALLQQRARHVAAAKASQRIRAATHLIRERLHARRKRRRPATTLGGTGPISIIAPQRPDAKVAHPQNHHARVPRMHQHAIDAWVRAHVSSSR